MSRPSRGGASYRAVLALPHARPLFAAAMLARLSYGLCGLCFLLSVRAGTGSFAVAGAAGGLFGLLTAVLGPARARLVEHRPGTLLPMAGCYTALLALTALTGGTGCPPLLALTLAAATGSVAPPVGPMARTLWGVLATDRAQRQAALSLDTVSESAAFAVGPAIGGMLIAAASAPVALAACAALTAVGFTALAAALRLAPPLPRPTATTTTDADADADADAQDDAPQHGTQHGIRRASGAGLPLRIPGLTAALAAVAASACALAVEEIAAVSLWGAGATGWLLALCSVGGVVGGLVYGRRVWRLGTGHRLTLLAAAGTACYALPALVPLLPVAGVCLLGAGAFGDALLITSYLLVDEQVPEGSRTEAGAWVNTGYNLGSALGSGAAGMLLDGAGHGPVLLAAAAVAGAGALGAAAGGRGAVHSPPAGPGKGSGADDGDLTDAEVLDLSGNC